MNCILSLKNSENIKILLKNTFHLLFSCTLIMCKVTKSVIIVLTLTHFMFTSF